MDEYIEKVKTLEELISMAEASVKLYGGIMTAVSYIRNQPAADVRPEQHGHWIRRTGAFDKRDNFYCCSECNRTINIICGDKISNYPYCHCGAKMDESERLENETD